MKTEHLSVIIEKKLKDGIDYLADKEGRTRAHIVEKALIRYLKDRKIYKE